MNIMPRVLLGASVAVAAFAAVPAAAQTVINFDDLAEGAVVSNQYAGLGVTFSANAFTGAGSSSSGEDWATNTGLHVTATDLGGVGTPPLLSGKVLHSFSDWAGEDGDPSFNINFTTAINAFSLDFGGVALPADTRIFIYNGATLLGTVAGTVTTGQFTLSYSAASITRVAVAPGSFDDWVGVDNLRFTQVATAGVPEPATWAMMLMGFGAVGFALRRRPKVSTTVSFA